LKPNEGLSDLSNKAGISLTRRSWLRYEKWELISEPIFRNSRNVEYPPNTTAEVYAAYQLMRKHNKSPQEVKDIRISGMAYLNHFAQNPHHAPIDVVMPELNDKLFYRVKEGLRIRAWLLTIYDWLRYYIKYNENMPLDRDIIIKISFVDGKIQFKYDEISELEQVETIRVTGIDGIHEIDFSNVIQNI